MIQGERMFRFSFTAVAVSGILDVLKPYTHLCSFSVDQGSFFMNFKIFTIHEFTEH